jgi:hypothetical protein
MTCCGRPAIPRTSPRGLRHFAHRPGAPCGHGAGETLHHLHLKTQVSAALTACGWDARVEVAEADWRADVLASRGPERVAFEVQWSSIDPQTLLGRARRYADSGVRSVWLLRRSVPWELEFRCDVPSFGVAPKESEGEYEVQVGGQRLAVGDWLQALVGDDLAVGAHRRRSDVTVEAHTVVAGCPRCGTSISVLAIGRAVPVSWCGESLGDHPGGSRAAAEALTSALRRHQVRVEGVEPGDRPVGWVALCGGCGERLTRSAQERVFSRAVSQGAEPEMVFSHQVAIRDVGFRRHWCLRDTRGGCAWPRASGEELEQLVQPLVRALGADAEPRSPAGGPVSGAAKPVGVRVAGSRLFVLCQAEPFAELEVRALVARMQGAGWQPALLTTARQLGWTGLPEVPTGRLAERYKAVEVEDFTFRARSGGRLSLESAARVLCRIAERGMADG